MAENTTFNRMRLFLFVFKFLPRTVEFYSREGTCVYTQRVLDSLDLQQGMESAVG